jgi:hypothetical protein
MALLDRTCDAKNKGWLQSYLQGEMKRWKE